MFKNQSFHEVHIVQLAAVTGGLRATSQEIAIASDALNKRFGAPVVLDHVASTPTIRSGINHLQGGFEVRQRHGSFTGTVDLPNQKVRELRTKLR